MNRGVDSNRRLFLLLSAIAAAFTTHLRAVEPLVTELAFDSSYREASDGTNSLPAWIRRIEQVGGQFMDRPACWYVDTSQPIGHGRLSIVLDRELIREDLAMGVVCEEQADADLAIQLLDAEDRVVVVDLFENVIETGPEAKTDTFIVPLRKYPTATKITFRRIEGEIILYGAVLYPVVTEVEGDEKALRELAKLLGDPLSPLNPLVKKLKKLAEGRGEGKSTPPIQSPLPQEEARQSRENRQDRPFRGGMVLHLDDRRNCVIVDPQRVNTPPLPPGRYRLKLDGEGVQQFPTCPKYHYAYVAAYGPARGDGPRTDITKALYGKGDTTVLNLPRGGFIGAFLQDSFTGDNSGSVTVVVESLQNGASWMLSVDNRENVVIVDPARVNTPVLPPGKYTVTLAGDGVRQGPSQWDNLLHYAYIVAFGPKTEIAAALEGKGATIAIELPRGGTIGAFLYDSYSGDNSGSVIVRVELQ